MRSMIEVAMQEMNVAVHELDESTVALVAGRVFPGLANNAAFEAFEEQEPFQMPDSPYLIFVHEQNAIRRLVCQDPFEYLLNAVVFTDNKESALVFFGGGASSFGR